MGPFCYLNGKIVPVSEAKVSVYDIGLLRGYGIYEALCTFDRKPFAFDDHMARFHRSTEALKLTIPIGDEEIRTILTDLIERNIPQGKEAVIRYIITGGEAVGGIEYDPATPPSTFSSNLSRRCLKRRMQKAASSWYMTTFAHCRSTKRRIM